MNFKIMSLDYEQGKELFFPRRAPNNKKNKILRIFELFTIYSSVSNSTGAMFIFLREKNGSTTRLQDTTIINFQEIVHSTRLL